MSERETARPNREPRTLYMQALTHGEQFNDVLRSVRVSRPAAIAPRRAGAKKKTRD